jgi:hypothetical protein
MEKQQDLDARKGIALGRDFNEHRYGASRPSGGEATHDRVSLMMPGCP